jgi:hypothetical protein
LVKNYSFTLSPCGSYHILVETQKSTRSAELYAVTEADGNWTITAKKRSKSDGKHLRYWVNRSSLNGSTAFKVQRIVEKTPFIKIRSIVTLEEGKYRFKVRLVTDPLGSRSLMYHLDQEIEEAWKVGVVMHKLEAGEVVDETKTVPAPEISSTEDSLQHVGRIQSSSDWEMVAEPEEDGIVLEDGDWTIL